MVDDDFIIDKGTWTYPTIIDDNESKIKDKQRKAKNIPELKSEDLDDFKTQSMVYTVTNAFSINWPYLAYQGLKNELMIINAFEQERVHRIMLSDEKEEVCICGTYITDSRDLFVLVFKNKTLKYYLYRLDLDNCNIRELKDRNYDLSKLYKMQPILEYHQEEVGNQRFSQLHARGSSRKDLINFNEELYILILHEDVLFKWQQKQDGWEFSYNQHSDKYGRKSELEEVAQISSKNLVVQNDSIVYFREDVLSEKEDVVCEMIKKLEIFKSKFKITTVYKDTSISEVLSNFIYDKTFNKLILFYWMDNKLTSMS